LSVRESPI